MATFVLEDLEAAIEVMVFPKTMLEYGGLLAEDAIVAVRGRLDLREDQPKLICRDVRRLELEPSGTDRPVEVVLPLHRADGLSRPPGSRSGKRASRQLRGAPAGRREGAEAPSSIQRRSAGGLVGALKELLGTSAVAG